MAPIITEGSPVVGACQGGCGAAITYMLVCYPGMPELSPPVGAVAYRGGHLCPTCARVVEVALRSLEQRVSVVVYEHKHGREVSVYATPELAFEAGGDLAEEWATEVASTDPKLPRAITDLVTRGEHRKAVATFNARGSSETRIDVLSDVEVSR